MRIALAVESPTLASPVARRFGRAPWLIVYDLGTRKLEVVRNRPECPADTGIQAARALLHARADAVLAGEFGLTVIRMFHDAHRCLALVPPSSAANAIAGYIGGTLEDL